MASKENFLSDESCISVLLSIVTAFGNGEMNSHGYVFDGITRLPAGMRAERIGASRVAQEFFQMLVVWVVFDPNPQNLSPKLALLNHLGIVGDGPGIAIPGAELPRVFDPNLIDCDFYVTTPGHELIAVASHEDELDQGERIVWRPVPKST